jgi:hypothetical protein
LIVVLGLFAGVAVVVVKMWPGGGSQADECAVKSGDGTELVSLDPDQAMNAATIAAVGQARNVPERGITIALATSIQESKLYNITYGDSDSLGLFQQRPSQGWGSEQQIQDPVYASGRFYDALLKVGGWADLPLTVAAQKVQRSAYPDAYARHEAKAQALADALTGAIPASLSCRLKGDPTPVTGDPIRGSLTKDFKPVVADPSVTEDTPGTLTVRPDKTQGRGWAVATWAAAHASQLQIREIAFDGKVWSREDSGKGWRTGKFEGGSKTKAPTADPTVVRIRYAD